MKSMMIKLVAVGYLVVNTLVSGEIQAKEGEEFVALSFNLQLEDGQEERSITWLKTVNGHPSTIATYHDSRIDPETQYRGRIIHEYNRKQPCQIELRKITMDDAGEYKCSLKVKIGKSIKDKLATSTLVVFGIRNISVSPPETKNFNRGETMTLRCEVDSNPVAQLSWRLGDRLLRSNTGNNDSLTVSSFQCGDTGTYSCVARNEQANRSITAASIRNINGICSKATTTTSSTGAATTITASTATVNISTTTTSPATHDIRHNAGELFPPAAAQTPSRQSEKKSNDEAFEGSLMSTVTFSSISTTAALAMLFLFVTIALCCRRKRRRRRRFEHSYASLRDLSGRSEEGNMVTTPLCHGCAVQPEVCCGCSHINQARRPLPALPALGSERPLCRLATSTTQRPPNPNASISTGPCIRSGVCSREASFSSHCPPPPCGMSRMAPTPPSTTESYLEVGTEPCNWNGATSAMNSQGSVMVESTV